MPPDDGGAFETNSWPRKGARTGRRQTTRYEASSSSVIAPPPSRTVLTTAPATSPRHPTRRRAVPEHLRGLAVTSEADVDRVHLPAAGATEAEAGRRDEEVGEARRPVPRPVDEDEAAGSGPGQRALGHPAGERRG